MLVNKFPLDSKSVWCVKLCFWCCFVSNRMFTTCNDACCFFYSPNFLFRLNLWIQIKMFCFEIVFKEKSSENESSSELWIDVATILIERKISRKNYANCRNFSSFHASLLTHTENLLIQIDRPTKPCCFFKCNE